MLRMPEFAVHQPLTAAEAVDLRATLPQSLYIAGGTDLLPNLKHHLHAPAHLVSLGRVKDFAGIERKADGTLRLGAGTTLHDLATSEVAQKEVPGLARAASLIAGPQHRRMGTLGGNVMLDTRCLFYNQTAHWRRALDFCLKKDGTWCHVIGSARSCVAAQSSDTVPMLTALDARVEVLLPGGDRREVALLDLFTKDGRFEQNHTLPAEALVTAVFVPPRAQAHRSVYRKVRARGAVDFPQLSVALSGAFDGSTCTALTIVVGATMPFPKVIDHTSEAVGTTLDDAVADKIADHVYRQVKPQPQLHGDPSWRRHMARVEARRGLAELVGAA